MNEYDITEMVREPLINKSISPPPIPYYSYGKPITSNLVMMIRRTNFKKDIVIEFMNYNKNEKFNTKTLNIYDIDQKKYTINSLANTIFVISNIVVERNIYSTIEIEINTNHSNTVYIPIIIRNCLYERSLIFNNEVILENCESF